MKKLYFLLLAASVVAASAQDTKFYPEGTAWVDAYVGIHDGVPYRFDAYEIGRDTVLDGKTYNKMLNNGSPLEWLMREEAPAKVYLRSIYDGYEFLAYDYDWAVGKEISHGFADPMQEESSFVISWIGQISLLDGSPCDYIGLLGEDGDFILRGIGSGGGILTSFFELPPDGTVPRLYSFTRNGMLLYRRGMMSDIENAPDRMQSYRVTNDGATCTVSGVDSFTAVAYDLSGRQLWQGRSDGGVIVVPAESLDDGVMLLRLQGNAGTETIKLMN